MKRSAVRGVIFYVISALSLAVFVWAFTLESWFETAVFVLQSVTMAFCAMYVGGIDNDPEDVNTDYDED